jgi:Uncharacterized protein conserved in bacteria (DUF2332)
MRLAADAVRRNPPELICADYVEALPDVLSNRGDTALTVVFQTISTVYLPPPGFRLRRRRSTG